MKEKNIFTVLLGTFGLLSFILACYTILASDSPLHLIKLMMLLSLFGLFALKLPTGNYQTFEQVGIVYLVLHNQWELAVLLSLPPLIVIYIMERTKRVNLFRLIVTLGMTAIGAYLLNLMGTTAVPIPNQAARAMFYIICFELSSLVINRFILVSLLGRSIIQKPSSETVLYWVFLTFASLLAILMVTDPSGSLYMRIVCSSLWILMFVYCMYREIQSRKLYQDTVFNQAYIQSTLTQFFPNISTIISDQPQLIVFNKLKVGTRGFVLLLIVSFLLAILQHAAVGPSARLLLIQAVMLLILTIVYHKNIHFRSKCEQIQQTCRRQALAEEIALLELNGNNDVIYRNQIADQYHILTPIFYQKEIQGALEGAIQQSTVTLRGTRLCVVFIPIFQNQKITGVYLVGIPELLPGGN